MKFLIVVTLLIAVGKCQPQNRFLTYLSDPAQFQIQPVYLSQPEIQYHAAPLVGEQFLRSPLTAGALQCKLLEDENLFEHRLLKRYFTLLPLAMAG